MLLLQWKERMDIDIAQLSRNWICSHLRSLTLAASLDLNTRLSREIRTSQNGGAFKIWKALRRTLQPFCGKRNFRRLGLLSGFMFIYIYMVFFIIVYIQFHSKAVCTVSIGSVRVYSRTEVTSQNHHWNHYRWHDTNSLERTRLPCWCL